MAEKVIFEGVFLPAINFPMQQNAVPILRQCILKNQTDVPIENIEISITSSPEFVIPWHKHIDLLPKDEYLSLGSVNLTFSAEYLFTLTEKLSGMLHVAVASGEELLAEITQPIDLLAYDQWAGSAIMPEMLAAFVTPNHAYVTRILAAAGALLEKWDGDPSFTAYQSEDANRVRKQMAAIYGALQHENIMYIQATPSFEAMGQRVRLCDSIATDKMANCLDLTLLYASCLEAAGLNSLLVLVEGHAFVGCWLEDVCFPECVQDDASLLEKRIAEGIHEICLVECTAMTAGSTMNFESAERVAAKILATTRFDMTVDVKRARGSGIRPIPLRVTEPDGRLSYEKAALRQNKTDGITDAPSQVEVFCKLPYSDSIQTTKQQVWERKLLDLSLRNTLLNFRATKNAIQLLVNHLSRLEDAISDGQEFQIMHVPQDLASNLRDSKIFEVETGQDILDVMMDTEFSNHRLRTFYGEGELAGRIVHLYRQAKVGLEENGANTLFLALGFLRWYENDITEKARYAPLVMLPVDIVRKSALKGYVIRIRDEDPQMNITLLELLRQDFGLTITGLDPLPMDDRGVDLKLIFNIIRQAVMDKSRWDVEPLAFLGIFSFGQFIMWNDIRNRSEELRKNKVVASLMSGKQEWRQERGFPKTEELDTRFSPADLAIPTSTDSSQLTAICAASEGNTFVLHGPPGTGKSQTITNIIANMLFHGKTVLFIAEKMAALSVVEKRLSAIGLGPFSLELHSNKARKKDVLGQLEKALAIGQIKKPQAFEQEAQRLQNLREGLNETMQAIHKKYPCGLSLYETISVYEKYIDAPNALIIPDSVYNHFTQQQHTSWLDALDKVVTTARACNGVHGHPLAALRNSAYSIALRDEVATAGIEFKTFLLDLQEIATQMATLLGLSFSGTKEQCGILVRMGKLLFADELIPQKLYTDPALFQMREKVAAVCEKGKKRDELATTLLRDFTEAALSFDEEGAKIAWNAASGKWLLPKLLGQSKVIKSLKPLCKNPTVLQKENVLKILDTITTFKQHAKYVDENSDAFNDLFGFAWNGGRPNFDQINAIYEQTIALSQTALEAGGTLAGKAEVDAALLSNYFTNSADFRRMNDSTNARMQELMGRLDTIEQRFITSANCPQEIFAPCDDWISRMLSMVNGWLEGIDALRDWCVYLSAKSEADAMGLAFATSALENGDVSEDELLPAFERALHLYTAEKIISSDTHLSGFSGAVMETAIRHYREVCTNFERLTRQELRAKLSAKMPAGNDNVADSSEIGILKRAIRSGGRGLSIRKLFDAIPNLLPRLCPCLLMSPISVAQYIDPAYPQFDLVIFDEASQLPTSSAVGAIARGKKLIVVGDPKQLPPTNFFASNHTDEDSFEQEDLESILDDCLALSIPETYLLWHYRSRHESLIAFSNREYYNNELFTFPSPNALVSEVEFVPVKGFYDRSKTRQNEAEAIAVVDEIIRRMSDNELRAQSIGVVTFSSVQQNLIDDKLQEAFAKHPGLDEWNSNADEPIFIKNLENVQGDERDVILFSVGYGPDADGKVTLNFGPLNRAGGWRRLNVAVSRARQKMIVYSTLSPEQIDLSKTRAEGVSGLRAFLEYAKNGKLSLHTQEGTEKSGSDTNAIAENIAKVLRKEGYQVNIGIGYSRYRLDIGIVHPQKPDEYLLGILLDGERYRDAVTARDRNILQDSVLETLGWSIHHVYAVDWLQSSEKEIEKIKTAIKSAKEKSKAMPAIETSAPAKSQVPYAGVEPELESPPAQPSYTPTVLAPVSQPAEAFYLPENARVVMKQIDEVIRQEAPVSSALLTKRVINAWGLTRAGNRINNYMDDLCRRMKLPRTQTLNTIFYWNRGQPPESFGEYRPPSNEETRRNMDCICKEEISQAVRAVLQNQISLSREDLKRETYKLFGFSRMGQSMDTFIDAGIDYAIKIGIAFEENSRIILK